MMAVVKTGIMTVIMTDSDGDKDDTDADHDDENLASGY